MDQISTFVRADRLRLAALFQSNDMSHYYLNGVHIAAMATGVRLAATDEQRAGIFYDGDGFTQTDCIVNLPKEAVAAMKRAKSAEGTWFALIGEHKGKTEARVFVSHRDASVAAEDAREKLAENGGHLEWCGFVELIDGAFPEINRVIPASVPESAPVPAYNGALLAPFIAVAKDNESTGMVRLFGAADCEAPMLVECYRPDFVGLLMPMSTHLRSGLLAHKDGVVTPPEWATRPLPGAAA